VRFLSEIPAVIGADMKTYGPFKPEDIGSMPLENARVLIKQSMAEKVETA
jgi:DNA replication initiation complex subunit (GINS family)